MPSLLPTIAAQLIRTQWQAFYQARRHRTDIATPTFWTIYGAEIRNSANFLRRTYAFQPPVPDPRDCTDAEGCAHVLHDGTLCPHFPVPGSRPTRCYRHVHHILALCALAGHITHAHPTERGTGYMGP